MDCLTNNQMSTVKMKRLLEITFKDSGAMWRHTDVFLVSI